MKFKIIGFILLYLNQVRVSATKSDYNDCHMINGSTTSVALVCENMIVNHPSTSCYSMFMNSSAVGINRPNVDILKLNGCENSSNKVNITSSFIHRFPNLRIINFSNDKIMDIQLHFVKNTESMTLQIFNASKNSLSTMPDSMFRCMPNLTEIDFSYNKIQDISSTVFAGGAELTIIKLSNNILTHLKRNTFSALIKLETLDLSTNRIQRIDNELFVNNPKLKHLILNGNPVKGLYFNVFAVGVKSVIDLKVKWNGVELLDISCPRSECHMINFDEGTTFESLRIFNASGYPYTSGLRNKIGSNLETLDLSFNNLTDVGLEIFSRNFYHLKTLNLEGNLLHEPNNIYPSDFQNLETLAMSKNQFSCKFLKEYLNQWKNTRTIALIGNPSSYQFNIEGIDCYFQAEDDGKGALQNDECTSTGTMPMWAYYILTMAMILLGFIAIAILCCKPNRKVVRISEEIPEFKSEAENFENIFLEGETAHENYYEEIPIKCVHQLTYDIPQFPTLKKTYM